MTTSAHRRATLAAISNVRDTLAQAAAEGRVQRGECNDWRMDALEHAGTLALAGRYSASREMAMSAREAR